MGLSALIGALRVNLGLDSAQFHNGLGKAQSASSKFVANFAKGAVTAAAGYLSINAAIARVNTALTKFGDIADKSAAAGVDSEFFQGIVHGAGLAGVEIDGVSGALNTFNKNAGLAAEGKGKLVSSLQALNPELLHNIQLASTQEDRIRAVADALARETDASRQAAIATAAFGGEGAKLVAVFEGGAAAIDKMVAKAKEIGVTVDRSLIARADELGDKLDTASQIIDTKLNVAALSLAPLLSDAAGWAAELARLMGIAYEQTKAIGDRQYLNPLQNQLAATYNEMQPLKDRIAEIKAELAKGQDFRLSIEMEDAQTKLDSLLATANALLSRIQEIQGYKAPETTPQGDPVDPREALYAGMIGRGGDGRRKPVEPFYTPGGDAGGGGVKAATRDVEALDLGIQNLNETVEKSNPLADGLADGLTDVAMAALSGGDALGTLANALLDAGRSWLNSGLSGLFSSLLGGGLFGGGGFLSTGGGIATLGNVGMFATGGITNEPAIFGESGTEAAVPLPDGRSIPVTLSGGDTGSGGDSRLLVQLDQGLIGKVLQQAHADALQVVKTQAPAAVTAYQRNGGV